MTAPRAAVSLAVLAVAGCGGGGSPPPAEVVVPDVAGTRPDAASRALCAAGLAPGLRVVARTPQVRPPRAALRAPRVRGTDPAAGTRVPAGSEVVLRVAVPLNVSLAIHTRC